MTADGSGAPVDLFRARLNPAGAARIGVMIVDEQRIRLGVVELDASEDVDWYAVGAHLVAGGVTWRVTSIRPGDPLTEHGPVATLVAEKTSA